jgi:hypothetical protein
MIMDMYRDLWVCEGIGAERRERNKERNQGRPPLT